MTRTERSWTRERLAAAIYRHMDGDGATLREACRAALRDVVGSGRGDALLRDLGEELLVAFERERQRRASRPLAPASGAPPWQEDAPRYPENWGRNLRHETRTWLDARAGEDDGDDEDTDD